MLEKTNRQQIWIQADILLVSSLLPHVQGQGDDTQNTFK